MSNKDVFCFLYSPDFYRYVVVGLVNTLFGYGVFALFFFFGLHYSIALLLATILGVLFNFKSIGTLVFKSHNNQLIFRFIAVYVLLYCLNLLFLKVFSFSDVNVYLGSAILLPITAVVGFLANKRFVFHNEKAD